MDNLRLLEITEYGSPTQSGNLLGIQPFMRVEDYASESALFSRLDGYLQAAAQKGWIGRQTVVALPEYLGTWLVASGESEKVLQAPGLNAAMRALILRQPLRFLKFWLGSGEKDRVTAALFRMKASVMAEAYTAVFSQLARQYAVTIAAGSIIMPAPSVVDGRVVAGEGSLYNVTAVFRPDGEAESQLVRKVYPTESELVFLTGAQLEDLPAFDTPAGRLGVLICADSWHPQPYQQLKARNVNLVIVPSALFPGSIWTRPWGGYNGAPAPADVEPGDVGRLTEADAWAKYALLGRGDSSGARAGINVFLHGDLWDLDFNGGAWFLFHRASFYKGQQCEGSLVNLWL